MVSIEYLLELTWLENDRFTKMTVFSAEMTITSDNLSNDHFELTEVIVTEWIQKIHDKMNAMFLNNVRNIFDEVLISYKITVISIKITVILVKKRSFFSKITVILVKNNGHFGQK